MLPSDGGMKIRLQLAFTSRMSSRECKAMALRRRAGGTSTVGGLHKQPTLAVLTYPAAVSEAARIIDAAAAPLA